MEKKKLKNISHDFDYITEKSLPKIENDLHTYTNTCRGSTDYTDTYFEDSSTGWFANQDEYNTMKKKM